MKVLVKPGNVYGKKRHPVDILRDPKNRKEWHNVEEIVRESSSPLSVPVPGPSNEPPVADFPLPPVSPTLSELEIEQGLDYGNALNMGPGGGVPDLSFLLAKAISPTATATTDPKTWGIKDLARLPRLEQEEWTKACLQELEALK